MSEETELLIKEIKNLKLVLGEYVVVSGGVLAVRGIREAEDIDILVSDKFWTQLNGQYEVKDVGGVEKIIPAENIEIFWAGSFAGLKSVKDWAPSTAEQISRAEIIDGISFQSLGDCLWFKAHSDREKDKADVALIERYLLKHPEER